jgi:hypothetical protein
MVSVWIGGEMNQISSISQKWTEIPPFNSECTAIERVWFAAHYYHSLTDAFTLWRLSIWSNLPHVKATNWIKTGRIYKKEKLIKLNWFNYSKSADLEMEEKRKSRSRVLEVFSETAIGKITSWKRVRGGWPIMQEANFKIIKSHYSIQISDKPLSLPRKIFC